MVLKLRFDFRNHSWSSASDWQEKANLLCMNMIMMKEECSTDLATSLVMSITSCSIGLRPHATKAVCRSWVGQAQLKVHKDACTQAQRYTNGQIQEFEITSALIRPSLSPVSYCLNTVVTTFWSLFHFLCLFLKPIYSNNSIVHIISLPPSHYLWTHFPTSLLALERFWSPI